MELVCCIHLGSSWTTICPNPRKQTERSCEGIRKGITHKVCKDMAFLISHHRRSKKWLVTVWPLPCLVMKHCPTAGESHDRRQVAQSPHKTRNKKQKPLVGDSWWFNHTFKNPVALQKLTYPSIWKGKKHLRTNVPCLVGDVNIYYNIHTFILYCIYTTTWQPLGPLLKVKLLDLVGYI